jgi:2-polyprenyl-3-methyl-5-hydroxy-6-metoxy-1,4-benzoquinol methylase
MKLKLRERFWLSDLMNCTVCESNNTEIAFFKNEYRILNCKDCGHLFTDLIITDEKIDILYSDDYFFGGTDGYNNYLLEKNILIKRGEYYAGIISNYMLPGKVLDIGCAAGFILKGFENKGWLGTGIEPNAAMVEYGRRVMGLNVKKGILDSVQLEKKFDLIIMIQVIGQINNLKNSIIKMSDYLKPGGHVLIETWNKDSITAKIFGKNWHEFSPPSTLNYFSKKTLKKLMCKHNFSPVSQGTPKKDIYSSHLKSFLKHKLLKSGNLKWLAGITSLIPGNIVIPYPSEDLFWVLFQHLN